MSKLEELTPETYSVPRGEERVYHVLQEIRQFDRNTGRKLSVARVQKYGRKEFERGLYDNLLRQGYTVTILHDPKAWEAAHAAELQQRAAEREAARKASFEQAVAAAVAAELARRDEAKAAPKKK